MSFEYVNKNFLPDINQPCCAQNQQEYNAVANYPVNPYQTSFYNDNGVIYPFNNPLYQPNIPQDYTYLGQIKSPNNDNVELFRLKSGQKVAIMPKKDQATIVKTFLDGGSMNESDKLRGISHTIEHMLFKGSSKLNDGDVFRLTGLMGAFANASTDYALTDYFIEAPYMDKDNLAKAIEIQGDMISAPSFDDVSLSLEKGPICSEISMMNDDITTVAFDKVIKNLFQIQSDSKNMVAGSIQTVQDLTKNDLINHHQTFYSPDNLYTVVVGDVDVNETINMISKSFTLQRTPKNSTAKFKQPLNPIQSPKRLDIKSPKTNNAAVLCAFAGPKPSDAKAFLILDLVGTYLKSFSTSDVKSNLEKINASFDISRQKVGLNPNDPYALVAMIETNTNDEQKGVDIFYDAILKLQNHPISDEDLTALKNTMYKNLEFKMNDSIETCSVLAESLMNNSSLFSNYREILQSITKDDVQNCIRQYFDLNKVSIVAIHPSNVSDKEIQTNYNASKYSYNPAKSLISFCGAPKISSQSINEYRLQNNTNLAIKDTNSKICTFSWELSIPPAKPKNPNIPSVLNYMFQKGTAFKQQNDIERYKELNGIYTSISVGNNGIKITADCLADNIDKTLPLLNELLYCPQLTKENFEEAKKYTKENLIASQKDAYSNLLDNMYPDYFPNTNEKLNSIDELKYEDVVDFYNQILNNAASFFAAALPLKFNPDLSYKVINSLNQSTVNFKPRNPNLVKVYTKNPESNIVYDTDDLNQADIRKSYKFPNSGNLEDKVKFELVNQILGGGAHGRLFADLREQQNLAYSVYSKVASFEDSNILTLNIKTTTDHKEQGQQTFDNVKKSLEGFQKHTDKLCKEYVTDEELAAAKMALKQDLYSFFQDQSAQTDLIVSQMQLPCGIKRLDKYIEAIDKVTKEDIKKTSQFIFSNNPTISILASPDTINSQMDYLETLGKIKKAA